MTEDLSSGPRRGVGQHASDYRPPAISYLGSLAEMTQQKEVGAADGTVFQGLDLGSV